MPWKSFHIYRPAIPLLVFLVLGMLCCDPLCEYPRVLLGISAWLTGVLIGVSLRGQGACILPLLLFFLLGSVSMLPGLSGTFPDDHVFEYAGPGKPTVVGTVATVPFMRQGRVKFYLECSRIFRGDDGDGVSLRGKLKVTLAGLGRGVPMPEKGDLVSLVGRIRRVRSFGNPGGFDYKRFLAMRRVHVSIYAYSRSFRIIKMRSPGVFSGAVDWIGRVREIISLQIDKSPMDSRCRGILKALTTGRRDELDPGVKEMFARTGTGHLLAISGLHVGIVSALFYFLFTCILRRWTSLLYLGVVGRVAALLTMVPVLLYGWLAGMSPSTQRAVIMVTVYMAAKFAGREGDLWNVLVVSAMGILIWNPASILSISFQFSYAAVAVIIFFVTSFPGENVAGKIRGGAGPVEKATSRLRGFMLVSVAAQLGTFPLAAYYFNRISLVGIPMNLLLVPLVGFVTVPLALLSACLIPLGDFISCHLFSLAGGTLYLSIRLMEAVSGFEWVAVSLFTPLEHEIIIYFCCLVSMVVLRVRYREGRGSMMAVVIFGMLPLLLLVLDAGYELRKRFRSGELVVTIVDVGQGGSALLEFPRGHVMLIDGGGFSNNNYFDVGKKIVARVLRRKKIGRVDTIVLTHPESDHLNGLRYVLQSFRVGEVWTTGHRADSFAYRAFMQVIRERGHSCPDFDTLRDRFRFDGVYGEILYPRGNDLKKIRLGGGNNRNNRSMVIRIRKGDVSFLFPGDILAEAEAYISAEKGNRLESTVLVVPHHGSKSSSTDLFLQQVRPSLAAISAGWKNRFGFPHPQVLARFNAMGTRVYRTDLHGAIEFTTDGIELRIRTFF